MTAKEDAERAGELSSGSVAGGRRILVVDDSVDSAETLALLLSLEGHETQAAFDARSAIELAVEFQPEVLLLDIGLPEMNGYELATKLRSLPQTRDALIIAVTGYGQSEHRERSAAAGFDHHLTKPIETDALRALLAR